jgi:hypothetical protein
MSQSQIAQLVRALTIIFFFAAVPARAEELSRRWVYLQLNLQVEANVEKAESILRRAAAAGYNGVVLADYKLNILDRVPDHYFRHAERFKQIARELKLEIIPTVAPMGYSDGLLAHNPNLAEGLPVKDAPFVVRGGVAQLDSELKDALPGGGFEQHKNHAVAGWSFQDFPGKASIVDTAIKRAGASSLRFENLRETAAPSGNGRVSRVVSVRPWRQFHASVWIKTEAFESASSVRLFAMGKDGRVLSHSNLQVKRDQDWTQHHIVFNSLEDDEIRLYCGAWSGRGGKLWLDDLQLEEAAFVNLLRRDACPLVVKTASGQVCEEGKDFARLVDPKLGNVPYPGNFDVYHQPPQLRLLPGSRIQEEEKLLVSFYHTVTIYDGQVTCCLADREVFKILADQVRRVEQLFEPKTYFLSHDEIRLANWCPACHREGRSAGELLAENMRQCVATIRKTNPTATLCVWSDMFDPSHNARDKFYLVQGDLAGSWEGLPRDMVLINWNSGKPKESLPFFGNRGHAQILAGYYDADPKRIAAWLAAGEGVPGINGVMYTTWQSNFEQLEKFAKAAWGGK